MVDYAGKFYLDGTLHFFLTVDKHELYGFGQREYLVLKHIRESDYFAPESQVGVTDYLVLRVKCRDKIF